MGDLDAGIVAAAEAAQEFVVIARHEDDSGAGVDLAQDLVHDLAVDLGPEPAALELPAVDDVADEIEGLAGVSLQEVEQKLRLAAAGPQMDIGNEDRPVIARGTHGRRSRAGRLDRHWRRYQPGDAGHDIALRSSGANRRPFLRDLPTCRARIFCGSAANLLLRRSDGSVNRQKSVEILASDWAAILRRIIWLKCPRNRQNTSETLAFFIELPNLWTCLSPGSGSYCCSAA